MSCWWFRSSREKEISEYSARLAEAALRGDDFYLTQTLKTCGRWASAEMLREPLNSAVMANHIGCVRALLEAGASAQGTIIKLSDSEPPNDLGCYSREKPLLLYATERGFDGVLAQLLRSGGDAPLTRLKGGDTLLHIAARRGYTRCVKVLLQSRHHSSIVSYNDAYETPATLAVTGGYFKCFLVLIEDGRVEQMDGEGRNLLHLAAVHGKYSMVERLLAVGYAVDETDFEGHTPMIDAILRGHLDIVKLLVRFSEIDFPGEKDRTALMFAAQTNRVDALSVLLDAGADIDHRDKHGNSALILGIKHEDVIAELLRRGAQTNAQNNSGVTALWYAAYYGITPSLHCLLKSSSNPELTGEKSLFPLEVALERGHFEAAKCIIYAGCPFRNIIYTLKQYTVLQVINRVIGGIEFSEWVEDWLYHPRTLKYCARRSIRQTIGDENISNRVAQLPLPQLLIQYVDMIDLCQFYNRDDPEDFTTVNKEAI